MTELLKYLIPTLGGTLVLWLIFLLLIPEKIEKWSALLWRALSFLGAFAHKRYIKYDLEGRVGEYIKEVSKVAPGLETKKVRIEFLEGNVDRKAFLEAGEVVLRLRADDPDDLNFMHSAILFISVSMLFRVKHYLSKTQRQTLDLFVTTKLLERKKPSVVSYFVNEYLHPKMQGSKSKVAILFEKFDNIDTGGLFFPVLLQELDFIGNKVFPSSKGRKIIDRVIAEVNGLIDFLETVSLRPVGEEIDLNFEREYCRCGIFIVGKSAKLQDSIAPYVKYIQVEVSRAKIDTIYIISRWENRDRTDEICQAVNSDFEKIAASKATGVLRYSTGKVEREQYVVVLRLRGVKIYNR